MSGCVILAAGQGKRMRSNSPKVVHPVLGVPMVTRVLWQALAAGLQNPTVVVGHGREEVIPLVEAEGGDWAVQEEQLGTAHAVSCGLNGAVNGSFTVLLGDVPLLRSETISRLEGARAEAQAAIAVLTTFPPDATGYGRIVRNDRGLEAIVEHRDCTPEQLKIGEINTGLMSFDGALLPELLEEIDADNDQSEFYLTDAVSIAISKGYKCIGVVAADCQEVSGVNNRVQLAAATEVMRRRVLDRLLMDGVNIPDPGTVWIEDTVTIGQGVTVGRCTRISGRTRIGDGCVIGDCSILEDAEIPAGTVIAPFTRRGGKV